MSSSETTPVQPASSSGEADGAKKRFRRRNRRPNNNNQARENLSEAKPEGQGLKRPNRPPANARRPETPVKEKEVSSPTAPRNNGGNNNGTSRNARNSNKGNHSSAGPRRPNEASHSSENGNRRRNNGNNNDRNKTRRNAPKRAEIPPFERRKIDLELTCFVCGKVITDLFSAIVASDGSGGVCHFDCAVENIKSHETLGEEETIVYIGAGNFAIAKLKREGRGKTNFEIVRKIEFEPKKDELAPIEWRKALQQK